MLQVQPPKEQQQKSEKKHHRQKVTWEEDGIFGFRTASSLQSSSGTHPRILLTPPPRFLHLSSRFCAVAGDMPPRGIRRAERVWKGLLSTLLVKTLAGSRFLLVRLQDCTKKPAA